MPDSFDGSQFLLHLRARWRVPAVVAAAALAVSLGASLIVPNKYTATVALIIEPPQGANAVSPIYLESLKTYEHFASSDELFLRAAERFQLRDQRRKIEDLKRAVVKVSVPRNTRIVEIAATLPDPAKAHALARFLADETIQLHRKMNRALEEEMLVGARKRAEEAARGAQEAESARTAAGRPRAGTDALDTDYHAWVAREELGRRVRELEVTAASRAERLSLLDPGVPPEKPSSPNIPLNLLVAVALALTVSLFYLTLEFGLQGPKAETMRKTLRVAAKT